MTRTIVYFSLLLALGCGQQPAVPVTVVNPPAPAVALSAEEQAMASWPEERALLYRAAKLVIKEKLLEFPEVAAEWSNPTWINNSDSSFESAEFKLKMEHLQSFSGTVVAPDNSGNRTPRPWSVVYASINGKRLAPVMWQLGSVKGGMFVDSNKP